MKKKLFREKYYGTEEVKEAKEVKVEKPVKKTRKKKGE